MRLATPQTAVLSALIFNALIIPSLIPLTLHGVRFRAINAEAMFYRNLIVYGLGGLAVPFVGIKVIDVLLSGLLLGVHTVRDIVIGSIRFSLISWILCGLIYPLAANVFGQALFPHAANGSMMRHADGTIIGSSLIGQNWTDARYFHGRPSATSGTDPSDPAKTVAAPYNASSSGGSNLGPTSEQLWQRLSADRKALEQTQPSSIGRKLPADMLTTSASGLDPGISICNAMLQAARVASARGIEVEKVRALIDAHVVRRDFGAFGEPRVNVLELNLALERNP
jgi:potassium-transporting ATPase KdpC subunit